MQPVFFFLSLFTLTIFQNLWAQNEGKTNFVSSIEGTPLAGIGVIIKVKEKKVVVSEVIDCSPAEAAGLQYGDVIRTVDRQVVDGLTPGNVAKRLRGKAGTSVIVGFEREDGKIQEVNIRRDYVRIPIGKKVNDSPRK